MTTIQPHELAGLKVNPDAQRPLNMTQVRTIVKNFDPTKLGVITLSERDGTRYIMDGQTRVSALKVLRHNQPIMATVTNGLDSKQEAERFLGLNNSKPVSTIDAFKVRVTAEDELAVGIKAALARRGLAIGGTITAIRALERTYTTLGHAGLTRLIGLTIGAWEGEPRYMQAPIVEALRRILQQHDSLDDKHMISALSLITPSAALARASQRRDMDGGSTADALFAIFVNAYNKGKRQGRLGE